MFSRGQFSCAWKVRMRLGGSTETRLCASPRGATGFIGSENAHSHPEVFHILANRDAWKQLAVPCGLHVLLIKNVALASKSQVWTCHFARATPAFAWPSSPSQLLVRLTI